MAIGRPRSFDRGEALDRALDVFWQKGYEGASLVDLTSAIGVSPPSLYAAFGNKEALFRAALDRYDELRAPFFNAVLAAPTARAVAETLLYGLAEGQAGADRPQGCLLVQGALSCSSEAEPIRQELIARRTGTETALRDRFAAARAEGDLPPDADPAALARFLTTVGQGMAVQAVSGATPDTLRQVAEIALHAWPNPASERKSSP
jgi:AcrR family transcriptional regulator